MSGKPIKEFFLIVCSYGCVLHFFYLFTCCLPCYSILFLIDSEILASSSLRPLPYRLATSPYRRWQGLEPCVWRFGIICNRRMKPNSRYSKSGNLEFVIKLAVCSSFEVRRMNSTSRKSSLVSSSCLATIVLYHTLIVMSRGFSKIFLYFFIKRKF